jgi:hypothetical protein
MIASKPAEDRLDRIARAFAAWLWLVGLVAGGCSGPADTRPKRVPLEATVLFKGAAVEGATVILAPAGGTGPASTGLSGPDGRVVFGTFASGDGVVPGSYTVAISKTEERGGGAVVDSNDPSYDPSKAGSAVAKVIDLLPPRYKSGATSNLVAEVAPGGNPPLLFELVP